MNKVEQKLRWAYSPVAGSWDEAFLPSGMPRRHWRALAVSIGRMGLAQLTRRWQTGQQLIQANGITYNVYGDPQGRERPWVLDPIPLVIGEDEWASIERAIIQRATLLNFFLADLYGDRQLIRGRHIPAELLFANPNFLRPCFGIKPPGGIYLHSYAADLARSEDGQWWVIADRTQAPSGLGYALENRVVSARTLPAAFNRSHVRPLAGFFDMQREALQGLAPNNRDHPRIVLLTPGPENETYFEHSFLARHWGFPLVEGADLTVRDNRVYLKTLTGLERIDLIVRRMDDSFCDPLELRGESVLGVPGLTQAVRSGHVAVANALGTGLLETSSPMAFLPGLCRHLLGEPLRMPSVATWWCGHESERRYVLSHLPELVIKPAFRRFGEIPVFPATMDTEARRQLAARIEAAPEEFIAQEQIAVSTAPVRTDEGVLPRHIVLRVFAGWDGHSYSVLPGGLTRVSMEASSPVVSMQGGGGSKDTWVLSRAEESSVLRPLPGSDDAELPVQAISPLPSRQADNLFWLGRYAERVEGGVRLIRSLSPSLSGEEDFGHTASIETSIQFLIALGYLPAETAKMSIAQTRWQLSRLFSGMIYDPTRSSGIGWNLANVRRVSWPLKERLSQDTWRVLQQLEMEFSRTPPSNPEQRMTSQMALLDRVIVSLSAFAGLMAENTTRNEGWRFLEIGKRLERAAETADLLLAAISSAPFEIESSLETLLQIADSAITYRRRYFTTMRVEYVLELLLADELNPRALGFQLVTLVNHLRALPGYDVADDKPVPLVLAENALRALRLAEPEDLAARDADGSLPQLEEEMAQLKATLHDISNALGARHFSHLIISRLTS
jgi:uncharacterized circularly permuted ATP-grasp superfamily protein/uncharacterized alpha-E superfamily protein